MTNFAEIMAEGEYEHYGVRAHRAAATVGQTLGNSRVWIDGECTEDELAGISTIKVRDAAEIEAGELAEHLVMVARDVDHPRAAPRALEQPPHHVVMAGGPVELLLEPPAVDHVADEVHRLAVDVIEEVDQHVGIAAARAEMDVADPDRAVTPPLA